MTEAATPGSTPSAPFAAACSAAFVSAVTISVSAPTLTDPLMPGLAFVLLLPAVTALVVAFILRFMPKLGEPRTIAVATSLAVSLPWLLVAGAPLARLPIVMWLGLLLAVALPLWFLRSRVAGLGALAAGAVLVALPEGGLEFGSGTGLRPLVVVGMDSSNWRFIEEMIAENPDDLPALQELRRRGAYADLESETPSASARIWTILATGVGHDANGIKNFGNRRPELRAGRVWDSVIEPPEGEPEGTAGVAAWLINTPADDRNGLVFNTPGWVTGIREAKPAAANPAKVLEGMGEDASSRPGMGEMFTAMRSSMAVANADHAWQHVNTALDLALGKLFRGYGKEDMTWRMKIMRDRINADVFFELSKRHSPDFGALVLYGTDQLGHFYWKFHEAKHGDASLFPSVKPFEVERMGESVRDSYRACDRVLARLLEKTDAGELTIMLMSDHGMQPLPESRDDKLLKVKGESLLMAAGGGQDAFGPDMVARFTTANVDKALYISARSDGVDARRDLAELSAILETARNATINQALFTLSYPENSVEATLRVDFLEQNAETLQLDHELQVGDIKGPATSIFEVETRSGRHTLTGFFLIAGPDVRVGAKLDPVSIYDMAPTMLYAMGKSVPESLQGRAVHEAFEPEYVARNPVKIVPGALPIPPTVRSATDAENEVSENALSALGYQEKLEKEKAEREKQD